MDSVNLHVKIKFSSLFGYLAFDIHWYKTPTTFRFVFATPEGNLNFIDYDSTSVN